MTRIGSLFSGYGGLEQGVQSILGGTVAWHSEIDPGACKILAHRYPDVPNLGDITAVDWAAVEPVDVLTGGFPCQDVSAAGKRLGIRPGTRSGLWTQFAYAIDQLRPSLVVVENVRGLLSASAHSELEPCPWCVGDDEHVALRALGAVLGDLADLGYDASWQGLRAADVGAPHGRFRVFVIAWPTADADGLGHERGRRARPGRDGSADVGLAAADTEGHGRHEGRPEPARLIGGPDAALCGGATAAHADGDGCEGCTECHERTPGGLAAPQRDDADGRGIADADAAGGCGPDEPERGDAAGLDVGAVTGAGRGDRAGDPAEGVHLLGGASPELAWGPYGHAIRRWERCLGRPAPAPTELSAKGSPRLSPAFVEWLMGLPAGWVTDVPGLTRNEQLKALGNGVVPQQAAEALRILLPDVERAA